ncbi:MAG: hypothetical protein ACOCXM_09900 [Myxococcota bacterium]
MRSAVALVALCVLPATVWGQDAPTPADPPDVEITAAPTEDLVTGDAVTLTITAIADADDDLAVPKQSFAPFEVRKKNVREEDAEDGLQKLVFELELLAFEPGDHVVGPVELRVVTADGVIRTVETDPVNLEVGSLTANEPNPEPKPPTEPVPVMEDDYTLLWILGGLALIGLVALLTLLAARWWRRRKAAAAPPPPPRPADEVALERLHALRDDRALAEEEGRLVEWVDGVSDALRAYLGGRYGFEGLESTTDEALHHLRAMALPEAVVTEVTALLGECDLVKFAQASPQPERCDVLLEGAYRVVQRTRPTPATPPGKVAA